MMTHRNSDSPVTIPLDNTSGEVARFGLGISHADTQSTQGKEALPQPPEAGLLTHTGRAGGRFDTTPLSHSGQKPNPSSRIGSQIHRRTTFKEGVATTDGGIRGTPYEAGTEDPGGLALPAGTHTCARLRRRCAWCEIGKIHRVTGWHERLTIHRHEALCSQGTRPHQARASVSSGTARLRLSGLLAKVPLSGRPFRAENGLVAVR